MIFIFVPCFTRYTAPDVVRRGMQTEVSVEMSLDLAAAAGGDAPTSIPEQADPPDLPQGTAFS